MVNSYTRKFKLKQVVKVLTLLFVLNVSNSWGQATIPVSRTAWGTTPTGWIDFGTGTYASSFACSGNDGGQLNSTGDYYQIFYSSGASSLSFVTKSASAYTGTFDVQESQDGASWTTVASYTAMSTACVTNNLPLNCLSRYVRFYYTSRVVNFTIDDISLTQGTCCTAPTITITPTSQTVCAGSAVTLTVTNSATIPSYTWQASSNGITGWADVANGTPAGASYSGINSSVLTVTAGVTYYYRCLVVEGGTCTATSSTSTLVVNTISITSQPISVTTTSTGTASYSVTVAGTGLSYQWQENSGSGFSNISNGGTNPTYAGATSSVLTISNPPLSMSGYSYQCVVSNACGTVTTNGTSTLTVNSFVCPFLVSAVVNSCDGCADEGNNEMVVMNSGSYNIPVSSGSLSVIYNNGSDNNFSSSFAATATSTNIAVGDAVSQLNTLAGCSNTFSFVPSGGTIPANSNFIILNKNSCFAGDFSPYCGQGPIYVVISTAAVWSPTGFFGNNNSTRWFKTDFSYLNASCGVTTYSYNTTNSFSFSSDGASVTFNGTTPSYITGDGTCVPPLAILPIDLIDFYATQNGEKNDLVWKVASENNILQYIIEKSEDGINFSEFTRVNANNIDGLSQFYSCEDNSPYSGLTYYKLSTIENNHQIYGHKIIAIDRADKDWKSLLYQNDEELVLEFKNAIPKNAQLLLFDLSGKLLVDTSIEQSITKINTASLATGIYFAKIESPYKTENFKIIISQ